MGKRLLRIMEGVVVNFMVQIALTVVPRYLVKYYSVVSVRGFLVCLFCLTFFASRVGVQIPEGLTLLKQHPFRYQQDK